MLLTKIEVKAATKPQIGSFYKLEYKPLNYILKTKNTRKMYLFLEQLKAYISRDDMRGSDTRMRSRSKRKYDGAIISVKFLSHHPISEIVRARRVPVASKAKF